MRPMMLRDYQWDMLRFLTSRARTHRSLGLISPTGSGKSLVIEAFLIKTHREDGLFSGVVIAAPSEAVIANFTSEVDITTPAYLNDVGSIGQGRVGVWDHKRFDAPGKIKSKTTPKKKRTTFENVIIGSRFSRRAFITSHQQLLRYAGYLPKDLTGKLLVLDEAHHAGSENEHLNTKIGKFVKKWMARGGTVLFTTATPFRTDGNQVLPVGTATFIRSISTHAASGYAPNNFKVRTIVLETVQAQTSQELAGEEMPSDNALRESSYHQMVEHWVQEKRPKALFLVPPGRNKAGAEEMAAELEAVIQKHDPTARVRKFIGNRSTVAADLNQALALERAVKHYRDSQVDIIIACQRFNEGTDWPPCSHVYCYGISSSFSLIIQRWGRAFRMKNPDPISKTGGIVGHPHADEAHIIFFVPKVKAELLEEFERQHSDHALMLACLMADFETAQEFGTHKRIRYEGAFTRRPRNIAAQQALEILDIERARITKDVAVWAMQMAQSGHAPTITDLMDWSARQGYSAAERGMILETEFMATLAQQGDPSVIEQVFTRMGQRKDALINMATLGILDGAMIAPEYMRIFEEEMAAYRGQTCCYTGRILQVLSHFTGQDAEEIGRRLHARVNRKSAHIPHTDLEIAQLLRNYAAEHGENLKLKFNDPSVAAWTLVPGSTVEDLDQHFRTRGINLTWFNWALQQGAVDGPPLTVDDLRALPTKALRDLHDWQTHDSPPSPFQRRPVMVSINGRQEHLVALDLALWFGWRGLPGGMRLRDLS